MRRCVYCGAPITGQQACRGHRDLLAIESVVRRGLVGSLYEANEPGPESSATGACPSPEPESKV